MSNRIYCGTSGHSYPSWRPAFYPANLSPKKFLPHYASRLNAVESNYTFRAFPSQKALAGWVADTPPSFLFAVKGHQSVTHFKNKPVAESAPPFFDSIQPLQTAGRLGPVLFQLPPTRAFDPGMLRELLDCAPPGVRLAFEFRHPSWFNDETYRMLSARHAALCLAESEKLETPSVITAGFVYFRLRKTAYGDDDLRAIAAEAVKLRNSGRDVFLFFMHQDDPTGPGYAETVLGLVDEERL